MLSFVETIFAHARIGLLLALGLTVAACNSSSSDDTPVVTVEVPGKMVNVTVEAGDERAVFTVVAPTDGGPVNKFTVTCTASGEDDVTAFSGASPVTLTGFVNGVSYSCVVVASNQAGDGPASDVLTVVTADPFQLTDCTTQTTDGNKITCLTHNILSTMDDTTRASILRALDEGNATDYWSGQTLTSDTRLGITLTGFSTDELAIFDELVDAFLSDQGAELLNGIRKADAFLSETLTGYGELQYAVSFHGTPSYTDPWMLVITGHNYAIFVAVDGDYISMTPQFAGVEPTSFTLDSVDYTPMAARQSALVAMLSGLTSGELSAAQTATVFDDIVLGPGEDNSYPTTKLGLDVSTLTLAQRDLVAAAIKAFTDDQEGGALSADYVTDTALDGTFISWSTDAALASQGGYVRIDGPSVWIEFVVVAGDATSEVNFNSILRDRTLDYGANFDLTD